MDFKNEDGRPEKEEVVPVMPVLTVVTVLQSYINQNEPATRNK